MSPMYFPHIKVGLLDNILHIISSKNVIDLSIHQDLTVGAMHALGWGEDVEAWGGSINC